MASSDATSLQLYLRLLRYVKPYWAPFALSIAAMVVTALTEPAFPALLKPLLDGSFVHKEGRAAPVAPRFDRRRFSGARPRLISLRLHDRAGWRTRS